MPLYEYRCLNCDRTHDRVRFVTDANMPSECPHCGSDSQRRYSAPALQRWQPHDPRLRRDFNDD